MGLAERFKDKLNNKNIFIENQIEEKLQEKEIMFISKPITAEKSETTAPIKNVLSDEVKPKISVSKFENLESELINKIRKTPYWEEYSIQRQEKMINSYFIKKVQDYTINEKNEFVKNTLILANNR